MILFILIIGTQAINFGYQQAKGDQICFNDHMARDDMINLNILANSSKYYMRFAEAV